jgi:hypothetical protein
MADIAVSRWPGQEWHVGRSCTDAPWLGQGRVICLLQAVEGRRRLNVKTILTESDNIDIVNISNLTGERSRDGVNTSELMINAPRCAVFSLHEARSF